MPHPPDSTELKFERDLFSSGNYSFENYILPFQEILARKITLKDKSQFISMGFCDVNSQKNGLNI